MNETLTRSSSQIKIVDYPFESKPRIKIAQTTRDHSLTYQLIPMSISPLRRSPTPERPSQLVKRISNGISPPKNGQEQFLLSSLQSQLNQLNTKYSELLKSHNLLASNLKTV